MRIYTNAQTLSAATPAPVAVPVPKRPLLKWAGGKTQELKYILPALPDTFSRYYEPFVGGGAVYTAVEAESYLINDKSSELIQLYKIINSKQRSKFFNLLNDLCENWDKVGRFFKEKESILTDLYLRYAQNSLPEATLKTLIASFVRDNSLVLLRLFPNEFSQDNLNFLPEAEKNLTRKFLRMKVLEGQKGKLPAQDIAENIETALRSAFYMQMRRLYNLPSKEKSQVLATSIFLFMRNFAYSGMFRYNKKGEFNVPYGGIAYNRKNFKKQTEYLRSTPVRSLLKRSQVESLDFEAFLQKHPPQSDDFIFLDPPYDTEFSTYARNTFDREDQARLAEYLIKDCPAKWMMVIKKTDFIADLYFDKGLNICSFDKKYLVSFMNRNDKDVRHLMIRNY